MYEEFFQLQRRPFSSMPDPQCFVPSENSQGALDALAVNCERGQGIGVLTGEAGLGKTLVGLRLAMELQPPFVAAFLGHSAYATRRALLQAILYELDRPYSHMAEQELRLELTSVLRDLRAEQSGFALIIDEAHRLTEPLLDEVRLLTLQSEFGVPLARLILIGSLDLEERLADPALASLNQRVACHVHLEPLTVAESLEYLRANLEWAEGCVEDIFTEEALELVAKAADGVPRCLNHLADHAMLLAFALEQRPVTPELVRQALDDLKQLPLPWNDPLTGGEIYRGRSVAMTLEDSAVDLWPQREEPVASGELASQSEWNDAEFRSSGAAIEIGGDLEDVDATTNDEPSCQDDETFEQVSAESLTVLKDGWQLSIRESVAAETLLEDVELLTQEVGAFAESSQTHADRSRDIPAWGQVFDSRSLEFGAPSAESFTVDEFAASPASAEQLTDSDEELFARDESPWSGESSNFPDRSELPVWNLRSHESAVNQRNDGIEYEEEPVVDRYVRWSHERGRREIWNCHAAHVEQPVSHAVVKATCLVMTNSQEVNESQAGPESEPEAASSIDDSGIVESYSRSHTPPSQSETLRSPQPTVVSSSELDRDACPSEPTTLPERLAGELLELKMEHVSPKEETDFEDALAQATQEESSLEERLGADVLDLYLDVRRSVNEAKASAISDESSPRNRLKNLSDLKDEPVFEADSAPVRSRAGTVQRAYGRLFSELRRKQS